MGDTTTRCTFVIYSFIVLCECKRAEGDDCRVYLTGNKTGALPWVSCRKGRASFTPSRQTISRGHNIFMSTACRVTTTVLSYSMPRQRHRPQKTERFATREENGTLRSKYSRNPVLVFPGWSIRAPTDVFNCLVKHSDAGVA